MGSTVSGILKKSSKIKPILADSHTKNQVRRWNRCLSRIAIYLRNYHSDSKNVFGALRTNLQWGEKKALNLGELRRASDCPAARIPTANAPRGDSRAEASNKESRRRNQQLEAGDSQTKGTTLIWFIGMTNLRPPFVCLLSSQCENTEQAVDLVPHDRNIFFLIFHRRRQDRKLLREGFSRSLLFANSFSFFMWWAQHKSCWVNKHGGRAEGFARSWFRPHH